jgi:hypothetical protein
VDLVAEAGRVLELETTGRVAHLFFEGGDEAGQLVLGHLFEARILDQAGPSALATRDRRAVFGGP